MLVYEGCVDDGGHDLSLPTYTLMYVGCVREASGRLSHSTFSMRLANSFVSVVITQVITTCSS